MAQQGVGRVLEEERCECGGRRVFQGYRERWVTTREGAFVCGGHTTPANIVAQGFSPCIGSWRREGGWSEGAIEEVLRVAQAMSSYREAEEALPRLAHLKVPKTTIHRLVERYGRALAQQRQAEATTLWESGVKGEDPPSSGRAEGGTGHRAGWGDGTRRWRVARGESRLLL